MKRPYTALRMLMAIQNWNQSSLAEIVERSDSYVQERMNNRKSWTVEDSYKILRAAGLPDAELTKYFPRNPLETVEFWRVGHE